MKRIAATFNKLKEKNEGALIAYLTVGDPNLDTTLVAIETLATAGVDIFELGIPFSDPLADGPVIQSAAFRALQSGTKPSDVFEICRKIRARFDVPLIAMTYFNPVLQHGLERFAADAKSAELDGVLMTDLPPEEAVEWKQIAEKQDLDTIFLLTPTSTPERIKKVTDIGTGFIYCVSRTGVTGVQSDIPDDVKLLVANVKAATDKPVCVGFGVSTPEHVRSVVQFSDGAIIGSALVKFIAENSGSNDFRAKLSETARKLKLAAMRTLM